MDKKLEEVMTTELHVLVDDMRDAPVEGARVLRNGQEARGYFAATPPVTDLYMDHDLGPDSKDEHGSELTGYHILTEILENGFRPNRVTLVTMNPVGREKMADALLASGYNRKSNTQFERNDNED